MASYAHHQAPSAPPIPMYPEVPDNIRPVPPVRSEFSRHPQEESLLPPIVPARMDKPSARTFDDTTIRRDDNEANTGDPNIDSTCNYNRYATKKTIGHGLLELALIASNAMQLRTLILQKQHDGIWIASLVLVCVSILTQIGLAFVLYIILKDDIRNPQKQMKLERFNNLTLFIIIFISVINVVINMFMLTISPKSFLDTRSLELLEQRT